MTIEEIYKRIPSLSATEVRRDAGKKEVRSFVLRSQALKPYQERALLEHFDEYCLVYDGLPLDFKAVFGNDNPVVIEIGFGMGEITERIARENPDINYIGIEVFLYGFSKLLSRAAECGIRNLRLIRFDAVSVLENMVTDGSVSGCKIFYPDPWQKKRHHKRRLLQKPFAELLARKLSQGGFVRCITDWEEYAEEIAQVFESAEGFEGTSVKKTPPEKPQENMPGKKDILPDCDAESVPAAVSETRLTGRTNFERKGIDKGHSITEILAFKTAGEPERRKS